MKISNTNWMLILTIIVTVGNAVVPFMPTNVGATVTSILLIIAGVFHINDVNKAVAAARAPINPVQTS